MAGRATQLSRRVIIETDDAVARVTQLARRTVVESVANVRVTQLSRRVVLDHSVLTVANAVISKSAESTFTADAVLIVSSAPVSFTADAVVRHETVEAATFNSIIYRNMVFGLTADAVVRRPDIVLGFDVSAVIDASLRSFGSFVANAIVVPATEIHEATFTASAVILKSIFRDDFNRTVAKGLGGEWSWHWYDSSVNSSEDQFSSVDGSNLNILSPYVNGAVYDSHVGFPLPATGDLAFDFLVPAAFTSSRPVYGFVLDVDNYSGIYVEPYSATEWVLETWSNTDPKYIFTPAPSTWYRVHARWTASTIYARVWRVVDPEPEVWHYEAPNEWDTTAIGPPPILDLYYSPNGPVIGKLDNIEFWSSQSQWPKYGGFQIGAVFDTPTKLGSFSAAAVISKTIEIPVSMAGSVDTFTDDYVALSAHIPDSGPMWGPINGVVVYDNKWWPAGGGTSWSRLTTGQHDYDIEFDYFGYNGSVSLFLRDDHAGNAVAAVVGRNDTGGGWAFVTEMLGGSYSHSNNKNGFFSLGTRYRIRVTLIGDEAAIYIDGVLADSLSLTQAFGSTDLRVSATYGNVIDNWNFPYPLPGTSFSADAVIYDGSFQGSFKARAVIFDGHYFSYFVASAIIALPPIPRITSISIKVNGIDITDDVIIEDAEFTSQASGSSPGTCSFRLKDKDHLYAFVVGQTLTLDINGRRMWGGWVQNVSRQFFFPYTGAVKIGSRLEEGVLVPCIGVATELPRAWKIEGIDYNILFRKRFCSNKTNRPDMELKSWPADTDDLTQIHYLCEHHLDLEGDGIDYTTMVDHVGTPNPDARGNAYGASWSWEAAMSNIAQYPGAIYYIDANKRLVYADVDTVTADYPMTDTPTSREVGYREMEIVFNGSQLVNDALVWGAGQGSKEIKFSRARDDASIAAHGLWQQGDFRADMWRQASVDKRADGFVFGSPQNKRGGKDDAVSVIATVFDPVYSAGEKVSFTSHVYGFSDVIPIRQMKTTFPTKFDARFDLVLSHYIDQPWNTSEFWFPKIIIEPPDIHILPPGGTGQCPVVSNPQTFEGSDGTIYQVGGPWSPLFTDDFNRPSGTQPDNDFGYWGDRTGNPSTPYFDASGLPLSGANLWFTQPITSGFQIIAKLHIPANQNWSVGDLFGVTYANGRYGFWVIGGAPFEEDQTLRTGDVFVRFVYTKSQFAAARIWRQDLPEPTKWSSTNTSALMTDAVTNIAMTGYYPAAIQAITVFVDDDISPVPSNEFDVWREGSGITGVGWKHTFQFNEPYALIWEFGNYDDFWAVTWGSYYTEQIEASKPSHHVAIVWSYYHCYGPHAYDATQQTAVSFVPTGRTIANIRVSGTVRVGVNYSIMVSLNEERPFLSVPVTVNFDVYDYESEPYWIGDPYWAALGRTGGGVLAVPVTGAMNGGGHSVDVPFSFDVPLDMLTKISTRGLLQWGVRVSDPFGTLAQLPRSPETTQWLISNTLYVTASVVGDVSYSAAYLPSTERRPPYFCIPPSTLGGTEQQRICESFQLANIGLTLEEMPDGSYDVPTLVREITLTSTYLSGSVEVTADGMLARPGVDFVEKDAPLGQVTLLNNFNGVKTVVVCYFPGSTQDWDYWHRLVM